MSNLSVCRHGVDSHEEDRMFKKFKLLFIVCMISTIIFVPMAQCADLEAALAEPSSFDYFIDIIVWRPLGAAATVMGTGLYVITLPFSLPTKTAEKTKEKLVEAPFDFTFKRPWGLVD